MEPEKLDDLLPGGRFTKAMIGDNWFWRRARPHGDKAMIAATLFAFVVGVWELVDRNWLTAGLEFLLGAFMIVVFVRMKRGQREMDAYFTAVRERIEQQLGPRP